MSQLTGNVREALDLVELHINRIVTFRGSSLELCGTMTALERDDFLKGLCRDLQLMFTNCVAEGIISGFQFDVIHDHYSCNLRQSECLGNRLPGSAIVVDDECGIETCVGTVISNDGMGRGLIFDNGNQRDMITVKSRIRPVPVANNVLLVSIHKL